MISKDLLKLPGADLRRSITIGVLQAVGALAEIFMILLAIFGLGQLFGLAAPIWVAVFVTDPLTAIIWLLALAAIKCLCVMVANQTALTLSGRMSEALSQDLYLSLFDPTQAASAQGDEGRKPNQSLAMLSTEGVKSVCSYFSTFLPALVQSLLMIVVAALVLLPLNWAAGLIVILGMLALPFAANMTRSKEVATQVEHMKKYDHVGVRFEEALRGLNTLKIFHADEREAQQLSEDSEGFRKTTMALLAGQLRSLIGSDGVIYIAVILATVATIFLQRHNPMGMMTAVVVAVASVRLFTPERQLVYLTHAGTVAIKQGKAIAQARSLRTTTSTTTASNATEGSAAPASAPDAVPSPAASAAPNAHLFSGISAEHLSFAYPNGFQALSDLSFNLPPTGHFALVGASGSGKSTLASLLAGRLTPYEGSVTVDGAELASLPPERFIDLETVVTGNDHLFTGTVRTNLDPAGLGYSDEALTQVLLQTDLLDLIAGRGGLDSPIEQAGANLSGGQRQRLSIARGLLRHSPVYIFDEATSAVDREHDQTLASLMDQLGRQSLVITITHRLAGVRQADRIFMLDSGRIVESGNFDQLASQGGLFAQQWHEQDRLENLTAEGQQPSPSCLSRFPRRPPSAPHPSQHQPPSLPTLSKLPAPSPP
ncbi:ABC transporter [Bombiscardovia nodaiensis]|uniref:ABC transporter n=1 Tax=Bombiscardovia nodaiensis TaxID=2932181 RepID=A0ABM8B5U0_9BIFI|nr:ABC transporter [Bombiscardovia nodaiensis]